MSLEIDHFSWRVQISLLLEKLFEDLINFGKRDTNFRNTLALKGLRA